MVKAGSSEEYAKGIEYFYNLEKEAFDNYRKNALETARLFDTEIINSNWEQVIRNCLKEHCM